MRNKQFINDDFLLENKFARELYHDYAKDLPIIDYHNHLPPDDIDQNTRFNNLSQVWINGDHYKWRAMRTLGIEEELITGGASDLDKFKAWAKTVPFTMRNPLYHWTHLELARYFGEYDLLNEHSAERIFKETSEKLNTDEYRCQNLLRMMNVELVCTTEDPTDPLVHHKNLKGSLSDIKVSTAFRPDKATLINSDDFNQYLDSLALVSEQEISSYQDLCDALKNRIRYFDAHGCRISDHGLDHLYFEDFTDSEVSGIFNKRRNNQPLSKLEEHKFKTAILLFLAETYHEHGWVQQFHLGALRNNNSRMHKVLGPDTGWDSIGDYQQAENLSGFLNALDSRNKLTKTILYNLNPAFNEVIASMTGNFNDGSIKGKVQFGSAWWFMDQKDGMTKQLNALSNIGLISCFVGMLTDSRSFLSFPRHEYFRRILCNLFGTEIEKGELPQDMKWVGKIVADISYFNAKEYFNV